MIYLTRIAHLYYEKETLLYINTVVKGEGIDLWAIVFRDLH